MSLTFRKRQIWAEAIPIATLGNDFVQKLFREIGAQNLILLFSICVDSFNESRFPINVGITSYVATTAEVSLLLLLFNVQF